jgi:hypothetical protein
MPKFNLYPTQTTIADDDTLLFWDKSSSSVKQIRKDNLAASIASSAGISLANIAALRDYDTDGLSENTSAYVAGYTDADDGGGGLFVWNLAGVVPDNNGTVIAPTSGVGRWHRSWFGQVNVRWFGATGDGVTDDTDAIQACIDMAEALYASNQLPVTVYIPSGKYYVTQTITVNSNGISVVGDGMRSSVFVRDTDHGTTLHVTASYGGGNNIKGLGFLSDPNVTVTTGSHLIVQQVAGSVISDLWIQDGFIGLTIQGIYDAVFSNLRIWGGQNLAGVDTAGSCYLSVPTNGNPSNPTFDTVISNFLFRNSSSGSAKYVSRGIDIAQCDGLWFSDGHVIGANLEMHIRPPIAYTAQNIQCVNVFLDGSCQAHLQITGAGTVAGVRFGSGCVFGGADGTANADAIAINCALLRGLFFEGAEWGSNQAAALDLIAGEYIVVSGCKFADNNLASVSNILTIGASANRVNILGCSFGYQPAGTAIYVNGGTNVVISANSFSQCGTADITLNSVGTNTQIANNFTDRSNALTAAASLPVTPAASMFTVAGATGITSLATGVAGQTAMLVFSSTPTLTHSANLLLDGAVNFVASANDVLTLRCLGAGVWTEQSRAVI